MVNKALIFSKVPAPAQYPKVGEDLTIGEVGYGPDAAAPENGVVLQSLYSSFDPYMRGRMRAPETKSYSPPFELGKPIDNNTIGKILRSNNADFKEGDLVIGFLPIQEYTVLDSPNMVRIKKIDNPLGLEDIRVFLGPLGMPGLTAYSSLYDIGKPKKGETIFVSAASGAVGQLVGQLAKHEGLRVIGSVGSDDKLDYILKDLGFDGGFNYKKEKPADALKRLAPEGIDIYYENVGGEHFEAALDAMNNFGRCVMCGMISQYNAKPYPITNLMHLVAKRITCRGFIVGDENMGPVYTKEHQENVQKWIKDGSFKVLIHQTDGIDNAAQGLLDIYHGKNMGKAVLKF
ncbi:Alcohol dehydrogenase superfamily zinc-type [Penicillium odoratum]|uniref:Alcohol dehydrogenase superfamily zinc-type n=1 Tax=Penicillium odoratum TaxID=1167516 RepID=UPI002546C343|nr:Alcohol dehydrogenase superfamily zinc-type [Penicillium odoratum]KAJ5764953.1 Alcohol dehydrogenase superfamily zinc-type [Penicillium odoratum]